MANGRGGQDGTSDTKVTVATDSGEVVLVFDRDVKWIRFPPNNAEYLANLMLKKVEEAHKQIN